ncbi:hypothetical protein ILYODFUR_011694 [Ilyodon furcidens]|uniref:Uncharacterized protein n=1 Tax=Ilyodon furcidens TaxID=33524 RepID=A0ABV0TI19_9TELE
MVMSPIQLSVLLLSYCQNFAFITWDTCIKVHKNLPCNDTSLSWTWPQCGLHYVIQSEILGDLVCNYFAFTVNEILGAAAKERSAESPGSTEDGKSSKAPSVQQRSQIEELRKFGKEFRVRLELPVFIDVYVLKQSRSSSGILNIYIYLDFH